MRAAELEILSKMPRRERVLKFFPRLLKRQLTREQYEAILNYRSEVLSSEADRPNGQPTGSSDTGLHFEDASGGSEATSEVASGISGQSSNQTFSKTTHPSKRTGNSQKDRLLELLSDGQWKDTPAIQKFVYGADHLGTARIASRCAELRKEGYQIECRKKAGTIWEYKLKESRFEEVLSNISSG